MSSSQAVCRIVVKAGGKCNADLRKDCEHSLIKVKELQIEPHPTSVGRFGRLLGRSIGNWIWHGVDLLFWESGLEALNDVICVTFESTMSDFHPEDVLQLPVTDGVTCPGVVTRSAILMTVQRSAMSM